MADDDEVYFDFSGEWATETGQIVSFVCPRCGAESFNRNDLREGYCGRCHDWTGRSLYDVAREVTDEAFGEGTWQDPRKRFNARSDTE
jgi:ribosomal protein L37E